MARTSSQTLIGIVALASALLAAPRTSHAKPGGHVGDPYEDEDGGASSSRTTGGPLGVGLILGDPTALTAKLLFAHYSGIQAHLGYGFGKRGRFIFILDYLFHFVDVIPPIQRAGRLSPYAGIGGRLGVREGGGDGDAILGARIPLGLSFLVSGAPLEIFAEFAVGIGLIPETAATFDGGIGGRFYF